MICRKHIYLRDNLPFTHSSWYNLIKKMKPVFLNFLIIKMSKYSIHICNVYLLFSFLHHLHRDSPSPFFFSRSGNCMSHDNDETTSIVLKGLLSDCFSPRLSFVLSGTIFACSLLFFLFKKHVRVYFHKQIGHWEFITMDR